MSYASQGAADAIPVSARLMALADVFDAFMSRRVYKPPMSLAQTVAILTEGCGHLVDPVVVEAFMACRDELAAVAERLADTLQPFAAEAAARA